MRKLLCALTLCGVAHLSHAAGDDDQATRHAASARNHLSGNAMAAEERSSSVTVHDRPYHITRGIVAAAQAVKTDKVSLTEAERKAAYQLWLLFGNSASMAEALVIAKNLKIQDETAFGFDKGHGPGLGVLEGMHRWTAWNVPEPSLLTAIAPIGGLTMGMAWFASGNRKGLYVASLSAALQFGHMATFGHTEGLIQDLMRQFQQKD